jgi:hypothetical protein
MDRKKIRDLVKQAHPKLKIVEPGEGKKYAAESDAQDADVGRLSPKTWKKFRGSPVQKPVAEASAAKPDARERFRPRDLTGRGPARPKAGGRPQDGSRQAGKLALERLVPDEPGADAENSLDVLVDEDQGIIGESDSGPDDE